MAYPATLITWMVVGFVIGSGVLPVVSPEPLA